MENGIFLDDKSYDEILREAMAMIPALTGDWTDFNPQDSGVMLLELCAGLTEMQRFYLDQVGDRLHKPYMRLLTNSSLEDIEQLLSVYARQERRIYRAVNEQDYREILLVQHSELMLDDCHMEIKGNHVTVFVYRASGALSPEELDSVRLLLEDYRLLGVRLDVKQIIRYGLHPLCEVTLYPNHGNVEKIRREIQSCLEWGISENKLNKRLNVDAIRSRILSIPDVADISRLEFQSPYSNSADSIHEDYSRFVMESADVVLSENTEGDMNEPKG